MKVGVPNRIPAPVRSSESDLLTVQNSQSLSIPAQYGLMQIGPGRTLHIENAKQTGEELGPQSEPLRRETFAPA